MTWTVILPQCMPRRNYLLCRPAAFLSRALALFLLGWITVTCPAQQQEAPVSKDDPAAAYEEAIRPFEIVRNASENWSEIELSALAAARKRARESCTAIETKRLDKEQLLIYARLCAFGEMWESVLGASEEYLAALSQQHGKPEEEVHGRSIGLGLQVQADLRLGKPDAAILTSRTMLRSLPYDLYTAEALDSTITYLKWSEPEKALSLQKDRQPTVLARLRSSNAKDDINGTPLEVSASELYREAITLPTILQAKHDLIAAKTGFDAVEASLPPQLSPKEARVISGLRRRYGLLDSKFPSITPETWLMGPKGAGKIPSIDAPASMTVFFVFPDWCVQCLTLRPQILAAWQRLRVEGTRFFALLATDNNISPAVNHEATARKTLTGRNDAAPRLTPFPGEKDGLPHFDLNVTGDNSPASLLSGAPVFVVPAQTLSSFFISEIPFVVITDRNGIIRVVQGADNNFLTPGGTLDQMVGLIRQQWP